MKRKYIIGLMAISLLSVVGCEDLDTLPDGNTLTSSQKEDVVANNPDKAEAGVNAIFSMFTIYEPNADALGAARHNDFGYPTIMSCMDMNGYDLVSKDNGYNWFGNSLDYSDRIYTSFETQMVWNDLYKIISTANQVIAGPASEASTPTFQFYLAQGLASRAFSYFVAAQLYSFNYVDHKTDPCVPILTDENAEEYQINGGATRATVEEVYTLMNADIDAAIILLDSAQTNGFTRKDKRYIDLAVAYGLKARIALAMEDWDAAASAAANAIAESDAEPLSIADASIPAFNDAGDGEEWMWGAIITETDDVSTSGIVNWISHMGSLNWGYANYSGGRQINKELFNSIAETDARKGWWTNDTSYSPNLNAEQLKQMAKYDPYTQCKFAPYNDKVGGTINANDIPLMRIEEMYLIQAEAEEMSGGNGLTILEDFVTEYRDSAYTFPGGDFQEEVFRQRRIELWGEGLNWFDVKRLKVDIDRRGAGYPDATMVFNIAADDNIILWRIPEAEIQSNNLLNEGDNNPSAPAPTPVPDIE